MAYQKLIIEGNVGQNPELRYTKDGIAVTNISVAVNRKWKDADGNEQEKVRWYRVTCWRRQAEVVVQYVKKGSRVLVEADDLYASPYKSREGDARASLEVNARDVQFLSTSPTQRNDTDFAPPPGQPDDGEGNIPF